MIDKISLYCLIGAGIVLLIGGLYILWFIIELSKEEEIRAKRALKGEIY